MLFYYEGRTIRGLGWTAWGLVVSLILVVGTGATSVVFALTLGPTLKAPTNPFSSLAAVVLVACGLGLGELFMIAFFVAGFHQLHAGRHEYGAAHERSVEHALVVLILLILVGTLGTVYSAFNTLLGSPSPVLPGATSAGIEGLVVGPADALLAGLVLFFAVRSLMPTQEHFRVRTAILLGMAGAAAGPAILILAANGGVTDVPSLVSALLAAAVAGQGISSISLLLFLLIFRNARRNLVAGNPAPVLPRLPTWYLWGYAPNSYAYPPPGPPPSPPR